MWLRLALKSLLIITTFSACSLSDAGRRRADRQNYLSYTYHYRNLDSVEHYCRWQLPTMWQNGSDYDAGVAETYNHLAFVCIAKMDYKTAEYLLRQVPEETDNQIEILISHVQMMRLCQRRSSNREFYEYREKAVRALKRINEERDRLSEHHQQRLRYAESEMAIVTSTYYYYVGLENQSIDALRQINLDEVRRDTAQYLNYLYNVGAGGILTEGTPEEIHEQEVDYLNRCLAIASRYHFIYFEAQAKEALADHTGDLQQAEEALRLFQQYGDIYQIAGAFRTLASCYHALGDDYRALEYLDSALANPLINQAPDLVASIREQLSVAYSAVDDKPNSDLNRNIYIDLQEQTRQDRELEARAGLLDKSVGQLNWMIVAVLGAIILLVFLLWLFNHLNKKKRNDYLHDDELEELEEQLAEARLRVEKNERYHVEQRAKVSLAMSILPLIDRILYSVDRATCEDKPLDYIRELTDNIQEQNELLTQWIQLRQGQLSLHIESFALQPLFDMLSRSKTSFEMKGVVLSVQPTKAMVKADSVLTLFMLNTLADNARKFTEQGGTVDISARELEDSVEISVTDTGCGMDQEQLAHVFDHQIQQGHGFGLMNCQGIIQKYRKISKLFSVCMLAADSKPGRGSRFYFRLPKGIARLLLIGLSMTMGAFALPAMGQDSRSPLDQAHVYADSAYFSNINGTYERTLLFADSCRQCLNAHYRKSCPDGEQLMSADGTDVVVPAEIQWLHDGLETNYQIVLDIRNESAVAALALHEWRLYAYNNKVYTQLFKELSADATLADYCRTMQQSQSNKRIAVILLLVLLVLIIPAYYMLYYRHRLYERFRQERLQQDHIEMARDALMQAELESSKLYVANAVLDNCLSALKHETMYYPSRIRQLTDAGQVEQLGEVAHYYRDLYDVLIRQAVEQVEGIHLHVRPIELYGQKILGDEHLLRYLFEMLHGSVTTERKDDRYVSFSVAPRQPVSPLTSLLCRQIVRDHGEATHRRGCGIVTENEKIIVILPRQNGKV